MIFFPIHSFSKKREEKVKNVGCFWKERGLESSMTHLEAISLKCFFFFLHLLGSLFEWSTLKGMEICIFFPSLSIRIIQIVRFFLNALKSLWREDSKRILFFLSLSFSLLSHCHSQLIRQFIRFVSKKQCNETSIFNHRNEFSSSAAFFYAVFFSPWKFELCDLIYYEGKTNTEAFISEHLDGSRFVSFRISIDPRKKRTNKKKKNSTIQPNWVINFFQFIIDFYSLFDR